MSLFEPVDATCVVGSCDTPYASWNPQGDDYSVNEIMERVSVWECRHVVLTGGEPMLFAEMIPLCNRLRAENYHITIETAGTLYLPVECDLMSISPKTANSAPNAIDHRAGTADMNTHDLPHMSSISC